MAGGRSLRLVIFNHDLLRPLIMTGLGLYLCQKINISIEKLQENRMDSTETSKGFLIPKV